MNPGVKYMNNTAKTNYDEHKLIFIFNLFKNSRFWGEVMFLQGFASKHVRLKKFALQIVYSFEHLRALYLVEKQVRLSWQSIFHLLIHWAHSGFSSLRIRDQILKS
jgi:hypothetical protein